LSIIFDVAIRLDEILRDVDEVVVDEDGVTEEKIDDFGKLETVAETDEIVGSYVIVGIDAVS
jgi:hypothetical protein